MSMYGYADALSQGSAFNSRVKNFNDGVLAHNEDLQNRFKTETRDRLNQISTDKLTSDEDYAKYSFKDGTGVVNTGVGLISTAQGIAKHGIMGYAGKEMSARVNTIKNTAHAIVYGEPKPSGGAALELGEVGSDGKITTTLADAQKAGQEAINAGKIAGDAEGAAGAVERGSSGLMSSVIKKTLQISTMGKIGDAGLSAVSEIGGKAIGDFSGALDVGKSIDNLVHGKNVFSGETTADKFQEAGAIADVAGIAFPPLELVGGALNLTGGIISAVNDIKDDIDKKKTDTDRQVPPPKTTAVKVSPAFQSMGLVASQLPSAKSQIVGSGGF